MTTTDTNEQNNFCKNVIDLKKDDVLFFDTNVLFDYLIGANAKFNAPITDFITLAIKKDCKLFFSPIVAKELLHTIARELYAQQMISEGKYNGDKSRAKNSWIGLGKSTEQSKIGLVKKFNSQAKALIEQLTELVDGTSLFTLAPIDEKITTRALELAESYGLNSADSFMASHSLILEGALVSLDKDMQKVNQINLYYGKLENGEIYDTNLYSS